MDNLKQKTLSGFIYKFLERGSAQAIAFIVQIILARLLLPEEFGTIALIIVLITVLDVFVTYGFGNSLVVNKNSDDLDFSTCFYFGLCLAFVLYLIVFLFAHKISIYLFGHDELGTLIKVMALRMPIAAVNSVQHAHVAKKMQFKLIFYASLIGTTLSGIISVTMAYSGFGVWALAMQNLSHAVINTFTLWLLAKWRPKLMFSFKRLKVIYDYGWKILVVGLIDTVYHQVTNLVIAKKYSKSDLAFYNRGSSFPTTVMNLIEPTINSVLFPALSICNDNQVLMKSVSKRVTNTSTYIICGAMFLLMAMSKPLVIVLLTEKWLPCVLFMQICCFAAMFRPLQVINNCIIRASGRSGLLLKINILKKSIGVILLIISMNYGVVAIAISVVVTNLISTIINIFPNRKLLKYGYREQFWDLLHNMLVPFAIGVIVWLLTFLPLSNVLTLIFQLVIGVGLFVLFSKLFKVESYSYLRELVLTQFLSKRIKK